MTLDNEDKAWIESTFKTIIRRATTETNLQALAALPLEERMKISKSHAMKMRRARK